jgi:hypothetical protein
MVDQRILASDISGALGTIVGSLFLYFLILSPGVVLVITGLRNRNQARRASSAGDHLPTNKSSATRRIIGGVIAFLFGLFLILVSITARVNEARQGETRQGEARQDARDLSVGECITSSDLLAERGSAEPINCGSEAAKYEVAFVGGGAATCPDGKREGSAYFPLVTSSQTLCFIPNFSEGSCYNITAPDIVRPESCSCPEANRKVDRRIDGSTDNAQCPEGSVGLSYPDPPRLFCFGPLS